MKELAKRDIQMGLNLCDEMNQITAQMPYEIGKRCKQIKDKELFPRNITYGKFIEEHTEFKRNYVSKLIRYYELVDSLCIESVPRYTLPGEKVLRPLTKIKQIEDQREVWQEVSSNGNNGKLTAEKVGRAVERWNIAQAQPKTKKNKPTKLVFNPTNESIDWAKWSWNPVYGCKHGCKYCYAADFAKRQKKDFTKPEFKMHMLQAPKLTQIPENMKTVSGIHNVFVCSMADLFGDWVPEDWIQKILNTVNDNPQWNYLFLTKNPKRLVDWNWPDHAWIGTTVDCQERVLPAEEAFKNVKAKVKFVSLEPFNGSIQFNHLEYFNWVIIGGRSRSSKMCAFQPKWKWVESVLWQARKAKCEVYFKPNMTAVPKEYPMEK